MTTSDESWSPRIRQIGEVEITDHSFLSIEDQCFFFGEYTPSTGSGRPAYSISNTNQKVANLKKPPSKRASTEWYWKERTIAEIGRIIRANIKSEFLPYMWFVPVPPSKPCSHPDYDSRMYDVARAIGPQARVAELLRSRAERKPASHAITRPSITDLEKNLDFVEGVIPPSDNSMLIILDDVVTTGATYCACRNVIANKLPYVQILGLFVARRVPVNPFDTLDF